MAKRARPRYKSGPKKGQFMSDRAIAASRRSRKATPKRKKARRNPGRSVAKRSAPRRRSAARRAPAKRRPARRNPPKRRLNIVGSLMDGGVEAVQILVGKAMARSVPDLIGAPKQGNLGLAVQAAVALASGYVAGMVLSPNASRAILAGGLTAPLETLIVAYRVPWLSQALSPVTTANNVGSYAQGRMIGNGVSGYARQRPQLVVEERGLAGYVASNESGIPAGYSEY